ncbi:ABC transporter ATP-binding protein [Mycoplasma todarodis]|uniref:ABC transporter ATP-binding protein n=1 Tax=Mycoplasma todarodis TaxID=1937191 RepID=UPI003B2A3913
MPISIKNVTKIFGENKALDDVSIEFKQGQITGLIGFNGSGKTTLYNVILKFIEKHEGEVLLDGKPITRKDLRKFTFLGAGSETKNATIVKNYLLQIASLYFVPKKTAIEQITELAAQMDFSQNLNKPIKSLSKGNQQKIKVIASFLNPNAKYIILDEPFDGLDPLMVQKIAHLYMGLEDVTIIITSHRMEVVQEMCEEFYVIKDGVIIDSKKVEQKAVLVEVNDKVDISAIKKLKYVNFTHKHEEANVIEIKGIEFYKDLTKELIKDKNYIYSTIKEKNIAESVFLGYGEQDEK